MNLSRLNPALLSLLLFSQPEPATPFSHFRYQRELSYTPFPSTAQSSAEACAILDADVFAHAASTLKDLRLYSGSQEITYQTSVVEPQQQDSDDARILNLETQHGHIVFDLVMPHRPYTGLTLDLAARDFIATAVISGSDDQAGSNNGIATALGSFTLFDLTSQHLFHNTSIPLSESKFPLLHVQLTLNPAGGNPLSATSLNRASILKSASVPPSREAQSLYTAVQPASTMLQSGNESVASFRVPPRVPIERIAFALPSDYKKSFSRNVEVVALAKGVDGIKPQNDLGDSEGFRPESVSGTILRIQKLEGGHDLAADDLSLPVAIGSNMQQPASIEVHVVNGSEGPLPLTVQVQMRQRRICFNAAAVLPLTLYYGDASLDAPAYGDQFVEGDVAPLLVELGPENLNPAFAATPTSSKTLQHRPVLRWLALLGCVCTFALLVIRSTHKRGR